MKLNLKTIVLAAMAAVLPVSNSAGDIHVNKRSSQESVVDFLDAAIENASLAVNKGGETFGTVTSVLGLDPKKLEDALKKDNSFESLPEDYTVMFADINGNDFPDRGDPFVILTGEDPLLKISRGSLVGFAFPEYGNHVFMKDKDGLYSNCVARPELPKLGNGKEIKYGDFQEVFFSFMDKNPKLWHARKDEKEKFKRYALITGINTKLLEETVRNEDQYKQLGDNYVILVIDVDKNGPTSKDPVYIKTEEGKPIGFSFSEFGSDIYIKHKDEDVLTFYGCTERKFSEEL